MWLGYARALAKFDAWLGGFLPQIAPEDPGDHHRPTMATIRPSAGPITRAKRCRCFVLDGNEARNLGTRQTFADVAATLADYFGVPDWRIGTSFLRAVTV
jgi:phosphopentomutase